MNELETLTIEATQNCSLVYLLDENLCLGNSYDVINTNFTNISSAQDDLTSYADIWYGLYTTFSTNSSKWLNALYNITTLSAQWESAYFTKESYKKYWDAPIYIVYPDFINYTNYYSDTAIYNTMLKSWLNTNFPSSQYIMNQVIDLTLNLYIIKNFPYNFSRSMVEACTPATGDSENSVCCSGCGKGSAGLCNHYEYNKDVIECHEICNDCGISVDYTCAYYTCRTYSPPQYLALSYSTDFSDQYINRVISLKFKNNKTEWIQL